MHKFTLFILVVALLTTAVTAFRPEAELVEISIEAPTEAAARRLADAMGYEYVQTLFPGMHLLRGHGHDDHAGMRAAVPVHVNKPVERHHRTAIDPLYSRQWHLHGRRGLPTAVHLNVEAAWADNATGNGIVIAVPDDGVESAHRDFLGHLLPGLAPRGQSPEPVGLAFHGTSCASTAAGGRYDGACGSGVAPNATILPIRLLGVGASDADEAHFLTREADIYSCSWGPDDSGRVMEGPGAVVRAAIEWGVREGRGGKGIVYCWAGGNGRHVKDAGNFDGFANSPYTIAVGAVGHHGTPAYYSELCACLLVTAPSAGSMYSISTGTRKSGRPNSCTDDFSGTSASAPMVAGVAALVLEANPALSWRDVQHIFVQAAQVRTRREIATDASFLRDNEAPWVTNGAGLMHSDASGFGLLDAALAVQFAKSWHNMAPAVWEAHDMLTDAADGHVVASGSREWRINVTSRIVLLETVRVEVYFRGLVKSITSLSLKSPAGTVSHLVRANEQPYSTVHWFFATVKNWGEHGSGEWSVAVAGGPVDFEAIKIHLSGVA